MNPLHWLEQHPNAALVAVVAGSVTLLAIAAWCVHWYVIAARYWLAWLPRRRDPGFDADWLDEPWTAEDADELAASWHHDLPGPAERTRLVRDDDGSITGSSRIHRVGEYHRDVWDEWWDSLDGLEREVMRCRWAREHEARLHADLLAETRELCAA